MTQTDRDPAHDALTRLPSLTSELVAHVQVDVGVALDLGEVLGVRRRTVSILGGLATGRLAGEILPGGADWQLLSEDTAVIEARYVLKTVEDDLVGLHVRGFRRAERETFARLVRGEHVAACDYYFRFAASLECRGPRYTWVNGTVFVGVAARPGAHRVEYDLYALL